MHVNKHLCNNYYPPPYPICKFVISAKFPEFVLTFFLSKVLFDRHFVLTASSKKNNDAIYRFVRQPYPKWQTVKFRQTVQLL